HFKRIIESLDSYTEQSRGGRGYHIIAKAMLPDAETERHNKKGRYEIYDRARFIICTGDVVRDVPIAERQAAVDEFVATRIAPAKAAPLVAVLNAPTEL